MPSPEGSVPSPEGSVPSPEGSVPSPKGSVPSLRALWASLLASRGLLQGKAASRPPGGRKSDFQKMLGIASPGSPRPGGALGTSGGLCVCVCVCVCFGTILEPLANLENCLPSLGTCSEKLPGSC